MICDWPGAGTHKILPLSQLVLFEVNCWYSISFSVIVPFWIWATMSGVGTMPVKFARYDTVPKADGAGTEIWYLLELSARAGS